MEQTIRSEKITLRVTEKEKTYLETKASEGGYALAEYVYLKTVKDSTSVEVKELKDTIYKLEEILSNQIDNLERKVGEEFENFGATIAKFLIQKFDGIEAIIGGSNSNSNKASVYSVENDEYVDLGKRTEQIKLMATLYELDDKVYLENGMILKITQEPSTSEANKLRAINLATSKEGILNVSELHEKIIKIERLKSKL